MSLIIDVLKRFKTDGKKLSVYPAFIMSHRDRNKSSKKFLFIMLLVGLLSALGSYFIVQYILSPYATPKFSYTYTNSVGNMPVDV